MPISRRGLFCGLLAAGVAGGRVRAQDQIELRARALPAQDWLNAPKAAFNGTVPGPVLRAKQGREISIRVHNELDDGISVHWHGVRLPNAMDGTALTQASIEPGRHFDYVFTPPDAGTFFYRATASGSLLRARGLHGMFVVEDAAEENIFDLPLVLDEGELGRLVNGARRPAIPSPQGHSLRLRILNAGAWEPLKLALGAEGAEIIAHDGQPAEPLPIAATPFELWPGQRLDIALPTSGPPVELSSVAEGEEDRLATILRPQEPAAIAGPKVASKPNPLPDYFNYAASHQLSYTIERGEEAQTPWLVNGHQGLSRDPLFSVPRDSTVVLTVDNISRSSHVLHLHGHAARIFELAGRPVARPVWRDTFLVRPLEPAKLLFIANNPGRWLIASTLARIFDEGLKGWFEVT